MISREFPQLKVVFCHFWFFKGSVKRKRTLESSKTYDMFLYFDFVLLFMFSRAVIIFEKGFQAHPESFKFYIDSVTHE